jgi:hypothetical protein
VGRALAHVAQQVVDRLEATTTVAAGLQARDR